MGFGILPGTGLTIHFPDTLPSDDRVKMLEAAWERIKPASHWKAAIDATVTIARASELTDIIEAIEFFTATDASAIPMGRDPETGGKRYRIVADGYWAGPAGP